jgi:hypothetical protein
MDKLLVKLSEIKRNARKKAVAYDNQTSKTKLVKQIIGFNPLDKEWLEEGKEKLKKAQHNEGLNRLKYLAQALDVFYFCHGILQQHETSDHEILQLIHKAETMYVNTCLKFIEDNIHESNRILKHFNALFLAVEVITESNPAMAQKYKQMLSRYSSLYNTFQKINDICSNPLTPSHTKQIKALITTNESSFKMYPTLKKDIMELIINKLDVYLIDFQENMDKIKAERMPSLDKIVGILKDFKDVYTPLSEFCQQKRYTDLLDKHGYFSGIKNIIKHEYAEWLKTYQYYSLPRNKIEEKHILETIKEIDKNKEVLSSNYKEIQELSPSPDSIKGFLKTIIDQQGKDSIINYYKIENELLHAPDNEKKIEEIVRFIKHLNDKLADGGINEQLKNELTKMRVDFFNMLDTSIENRIKQAIANKVSQNNLKHFFDKTLAYLYEINDLNKINYWQNIKKIIFKALLDIPSMIEDLQKSFDYMASLPESSAKETLKEKVSSKLHAVNEIIPVMALYQIGEVQKYLNIIGSMEKGLNVKPKLSSGFDRLIVLDKYTTKNLVIFKKDTIQIGRAEANNDIILKSDWVSGSHCTLNFALGQLVDNGSTNGTFINQEKIKSLDLDKLDLLNVANAFEIQIEKFANYHIIKVVKVLDKELLSSNKDYIQSLFNTEFVWLRKNGELAINSFTGRIQEPDDNNMNEIVVINEDKFIVIDKENSKNALELKENEEINTDRFNIYLT